MNAIEQEILREPEVIKVRLMKQGPSNVTIFVLGNTGSGKSTLMANLLLRKKRFIIFDTRNEYDPLFFGGQISIANTPIEVAEQLNNGIERIIFKVPFGDNDDIHFNLALSYVYQFQASNAENLNVPITVSIDEINRFAESQSWPPALADIVQRGRDYKIEKLFGAQWFGMIPPWIRDSVSEIYVFRHQDPRGLEKLEQFGFDANDLQNLPDHVCLYQSKGKIVQIKIEVIHTKDYAKDK